MVRVLFRTGFGVGAQMKRSVRVAARKRERQQHDQAAQENGSLHRKSIQLRRFSEVLLFPHSTRPFQGEVGPRVTAPAEVRGGARLEMFSAVRPPWYDLSGWHRRQLPQAARSPTTVAHHTQLIGDIHDLNTHLRFEHRLAQ